MSETDTAVDAAPDEAVLDSVGPVVDVDSQIQEDLDEIADHIDDRDPTKEIVKLSKAPRTYLYSGMSTYNLYDYKRADESGTPLLDDRDATESIHADAVDERRIDLGIDTSVVNPTVNLGLAEMNNQRFATALASAYNSWLVEELDDYDGLVGNMVVSPDDPEKAADEIDRMAPEDDIVGLELPSTGMTPPPGYKQYRPIYEAAERHGLPISMHGVVGMRSFHQYFYSSQTYAEDHVNHPAFVHMRNIDSLVFEGVPELYPDLDFVVNGMGLGFVPYLISRMDDHYLELGYEVPVLEQMPNKYFAESFYWSTRPLGELRGNPEYIARNVHMIGTDNVVFGSDIPHPVSDRPVDAVVELERHFDAETLGDVMGGNARDVYGL